MTDAKLPFNPTFVNPIDDFTDVKLSEIHGLGLFAKKFIPKGTIWWHARMRDVLIFSQDQFKTLESSVKSSLMEDYLRIVLIYAYYERSLDALIFCLDNSKYVNHSFNANSGSLDDLSCFCSVALKNIEVGEELTEDYSKYTLCKWLERYKEYFDPSCW